MQKINCALKNEAQDIFLHCVSGYRDQDLKNRLKEVAFLIHESEVEYKAISGQSRWFKICQSETVGDIVTKDEMVSLYENKLVPEGSPGRSFYDKIRNSTQHNMCPLCTLSKVWTLDHYLPKSKYPSLAVTPVNLIPACYECNLKKSTDVADEESKQTLHPYFDDVSDDRWIYARLLEGKPVAFQFYVDPPDDWSRILKGRVSWHFETYKLSERLPSYANSEYHDMKDNLYDAFLRDGFDGLVNDLKSKRDSCFKRNKNSWRGAIWDALLKSEWFLDEGVVLIPEE